MTRNTVEFNEDELQAPEWINEEFFSNVLECAENSKDIKITNLQILPATVKGDHYASVMFRASVDYSLNGKAKQKSMILKTMPESDGEKKNLLGDSKIFETEIGVYSEVIPKFESILREVGDNTILGPPCLYYSLSPKKVIIFEDIVPMGYEVLRGRRLNLEEVKSAYTIIAKWHAVGYKMNLEEPEFFEKYRHGFFNNRAMAEHSSFADSMEDFIELLGEHSDLVKYKKYFEQLEKKILPRVVESFDEYRKNPQPSAIYVLCHGDFHIKNLMFKNNPETGKLDDVMLLDYQMSYIGPVGNDIVYSMYMLLNVEQRANYLDELLYFYFTTFQDTLRKIGFEGKIPKMTQFLQQMMNHTSLELLLLTTFLPIWESFCDAKIDIEEVSFSKELRKMLYEKQEYIDEVRYWLPKYLYKGYFED